MYSELKDSSEMKPNNLHTIISEAHHLRRPPSLSDSFTFSKQNIERASSFHTLLDIEKHSIQETPPLPEQPIEVRTYCAESFLCNLLLRFLFHIVLISIFETFFFFQYVSKLEDTALTGTIGGFTNTLVNSCSNLTRIQQNYINEYITPYLNISSILQNGQNEYVRRLAHNHILFLYSFLYIGILSSVFLISLCIAYYRHLKIHIRGIFLENAGFILFLGMYEYMFFSNIIVPYSSITSSEIVKNTVLQIESTCRIL